MDVDAYEDGALDVEDADDERAGEDDEQVYWGEVVCLAEGVSWGPGPMRVSNINLV